MGVFGFDEQAVMFDVTPVENQFIHDFMLTANGDYVKVYLYGLMQCYHELPDMTLQQMATELGLTEEDVLKAFRHWERKGLVKRISDKPPTFRYANVKQRMMMGSPVQEDPAYTAFAESVYSLFGNARRIHGKEMAQCYEWVEEMNLPPEVVIMLLQHMMATKGPGFSIAAAQKLAMQLADEHVASIEDAELFLGKERAVWDGTRRVLRRLGKRRNPSEDEMTLYRKWLTDWGYAADAIEAACAETTKGEPTMAYLDGILRGMLQRKGKAMTTSREVEQTLAGDKARVEPLKQLLSVLGVRDLTINEGTLRAYEDMKTMYPDEIVLLAGQVCSGRGGRLDDVAALLESWQRRGLKNQEEIQAHLTRVKQNDKLLRTLYESWGKPLRITNADRDLVQKWQDTLSLGEDMIVFCAAFAASATKPMAYLDTILTDFASRGVSTPEAAAADRAAHNEPEKAAAKPRTGKVVREQQYDQREYTPGMELPAWMKAQLEAMDDDDDAE